MKSVKKTLSIVLAAVMLFAVCSMSVSAAVPEGNAIALGIRTTGTSYKAGDVVTFVVSLEETADFYTNYGGLNVGEFELAYNNAIFEPVTSYEDITLAGHNVKFADETEVAFKVASGVDTGNSSIAKVEADLVDSVNDWNEAIHIGLAEKSTAALDQRYIDCSKGAVDTFTFQLKIKNGVADGTYKVGHNKTGYDNYSVYVVSGTESDPSHGWYVYEEATLNCTPIYDFGTCDVTVSSSGGSGDSSDETKITVEHAGNATESTKVRWATADEDTRKNVLYVGFEGKISGLTNVSTLSEVGFKFSTSDANLADANKVTSVKTFVIYDFTAEAAGTYKFRSIVRRPILATDVDDKTTNDTESLNIYAQAYVVLAGSTTPITATDIISTSLKAEYDYATGNGMQKLEDRLA